MIVRGRTPQGDSSESYQARNGTYTWTSPVDHGSGKTRPNLAYLASGGTLDSSILIIDAMLKSPTHAVDLLPSGHGPEKVREDAAHEPQGGEGPGLTKPKL